MNHAFWHQLVPRTESSPAVDPRRRLRLMVVVFSVAWIVILGRAVQLERRYGNAFRAEALKPLRREIALPAVRGRILARDGSPLAVDEQLQALAVHYRYLQSAPDETWLRNQARLRLSRPDRRNRERVEAERTAFLAELQSLNLRLAELCRLSPENWRARTARIERRIETMAAHVNRRQWDRFEQRMAITAHEPAVDRPPWWNMVSNLPDALRALGAPDEAQWEPVVLKEQLDYHIVVENLPGSVAEELRTHPERYPGVRVIDVPRRTYPRGSLAANVIGHLADGVGVLGLERVGEPCLVGYAGKAVEHTDRRGQLLSTQTIEPARHGSDVPLTIDPDCQQTAEALLDRTLERNHRAQGGAIVLLDVTTGDVLALATAPRFNPNSFALADSEAINAALTSPDKPLFDRATRMALPPGALLKPFIAVAMLESKRVPAHAPYHCEGFLGDPEGLCCAIYRQQGIGHSALTLADALACNCNMYFLHYAGELGADPFIRAARAFGFGSGTGFALSSESSGTLPQPKSTSDDRSPRYATGEAQLLSIGQGAVTVTPLQMACAMATLANDGRLVQPRIIDDATAISVPVDVRSSSLAAVRNALRRAVTDEEGTAHDTLSPLHFGVAGTTGTGEVAGKIGDHAWCAGYLPAENPRFAFVVTIEHGGDGARVAAPIAGRLLERLDQLGRFGELVARRERTESDR